MSTPSTPGTPGAKGAPARPPKIPPPPNLDPPPYTPYCEASASLLPGPSSSQPAATVATTASGTRNTRQSSESNPRVVQPSGFRRCLQLCTKRNCCLLLGLMGFVLIALLALNLWMSMGGEPEHGEVPPLNFDSKSLARFHTPDMRINYDENSDSVVLSRFYKAQKQLRSEKLSIQEYDIGFLSASHDMDEENYDDCTRFTDNVVCCATSIHSRHHKTDCWFRKGEESEKSHAAKYSFVNEWQALEGGQAAVLLFNFQRHAILDLNHNRIYKIEENELPSGYISVSFFFPMDSVEELAELVRSGEDFKICEYVLAAEENRYMLKDERCRDTPFTVEFELSHVKFCSNPLYDAVLQYGHYRNDDSLTWSLRVKYDSSEKVYSARDSLHTPLDQVAIDCNNEVVDLYVLGAQQLIEYNVELPQEVNQHFRVRRRLRAGAAKSSASN